MMSSRADLVVIGGGAAGFMGAIRAKQQAPHLDILILEAANKVLGKVKISGGGRCNVTHACFDVGQLVQYYPRNGRSLKGLFNHFGPQDTVRWFEAHGVPLKTESDGRMFPVTDDSQTIIDCLIGEARKKGIRIQTACRVRELKKTGEGFYLSTDRGDYEAAAVLLATGGTAASHPWLSELGHTIIPPVPSLFTFNIRDSRLQDLAGISFPSVRGKLEVAGEKPIVQEGPLLITHWGLSGPVILRLSAWGARVLHQSQYQAALVVDFFPDKHFETLQAEGVAQKNNSPKRQIGNECPWDLPKRFWQKLLESEGVSLALPWADVPNKTLNRLVETLKHCSFQVKGKGVFKEEFVTAGGVPLKEIDLKTMQSKVCPGLFLAGEIIDVDGLTGGFNFQNAWSTGWVSGESAARMLISA